LGMSNTAAEMDSAAMAYAKVVERLRGFSPDWQEFSRQPSASESPASESPRAPVRNQNL
jgi:hypothetical protein